MTTVRRMRPERRGTVAVAMIIVLALANLLILGLVLAGARDQSVTLRRLDTVRAFYAAEGGMNIAVRELVLSTDEDGDGTIGSVSDDGDDGNNPAVGDATVLVTQAAAGGDVTVTSEGSSGEAVREIEVALTTN